MQRQSDRIAQAGKALRDALEHDVTALDLMANLAVPESGPSAAVVRPKRVKRRLTDDRPLVLSPVLLRHG